ncbi:MAG: zeta toxin family protein [Clostridia bacterium]|nr:zeta toxin family protein [Clostridia bacterium]
MEVKDFIGQGKSPEYIEFLKTRISPNVKPEIAELMIEYALTPEQHEKVFHRIEDYCFFGKTPVINPKIYLVISQTGAGKSSLTSHLMKVNHHNTVVIDSDAFKAFNPRKNFICAKYPTLYGYLTGIDAYLHRDEIYQKALKEGYNVLIEVAPSTKERLFNIDFEELENYGYAIDANILAVSRINSLLSIHERFEGQIEAKMNSPKLTDFKRANDSYDSLGMVLEDLLDLDKVDVKIWQRGSYDDMEEGEYMPSPVLLTTDKDEAVSVFNEARRYDEEKTLIEAEKRIKIVKEQMEARRAPTDQRAQFAKVEKIILENEFTNN